MTSVSRHIQHANAKVRGTTPALSPDLSLSDVVEQLTTVTVISFSRPVQRGPCGGSSVRLEPLSPELNPEAAGRTSDRVTAQSGPARPFSTLCFLPDEAQTVNQTLRRREYE